MADDRLQFIHIPKTAGTTLISVLDAQFAAEEICPAQLWRELLTLPQEDLPRYRLFRGHFGGGGIRAFLPEDPTYITMLRDPIRLAVSTYKFIQREPGTRKHRHVAGSEMTFAQFIDDRKTRIAVTDKQVRNLSLELNHRPGQGPVVPVGTPRSEVDAWLKEHRAPRTDDTRFDAAMARLEACKWFGFVERFDDSMALLTYTFGWPPVGRVQKLRVAGGGDELSDDLREKLETRNRQDRALYDHASRVFDSRIDAMRRDLDRYRVSGDVESDDLLDELLDRHYLAERPVRPVCDRIRLDFDESLPGSGWQRREVAPADGSTFRWTGPNPIATLDLDLDRSIPHRVTVRLIDAVSPEAADSLVLMVDGRLIDTTVIEGSGTCLVVQGEIESRAGDDPTGVTRLAFEVASMGRVRSSHPLNPDEREVGVAVNWVDVRPASELAAGTPPETQSDPARDLLRQQRRRDVRVRRLSHRMAGIPVIGRWLQQQYAGRDR